jgi:hypothetical protein
MSMRPEKSPLVAMGSAAWALASNTDKATTARVLRNTLVSVV